jgi:hypothetical protein
MRSKGCKDSDGIVGRTLKDSDSRGEVVDTPRSADSGGDDRRRRDEIISEAVVQVSLLTVSQLALSIWERQLIPRGMADAGGVQVQCDERTWSSKTSLTLSNSFSYLFVGTTR